MGHGPEPELLRMVHGLKSDITQTTALNPSSYEWFTCHGPEPELLRMVHGLGKAITLIRNFDYTD